MTATRFGATPEEWDRLLSVVPMADLLPVVSNPNLKISPLSTLKDIGKVPSTINKVGQVSGFPEWPKHRAAPHHIADWRGKPDYGVCVITRTIRAIDVDVNDAETARAIQDLIAEAFGKSFAIRTRSNSAKFLVPVRIDCDPPLTKRILKTRHGNIEFLADGQQFIAAGTHPSGVRYELSKAGIATAFLGGFEQLWSALTSAFGVEESVTLKPSTRVEHLKAAIDSDPVVQTLSDRGMIRSQGAEGKLHIRCPFEEQHTAVGHDDDTSTSYFPAHTGGYVQGHFVCLHSHCSARSDADFRAAIGYDELTFEPVVDETTPQPAFRKLQVLTLNQFGLAKPMRWLIRGVIPRAEIGMIYGEPGSGKTFFALDLACAMARGTEWRGITRPFASTGVYVAAEGANGFRVRLLAYNEKIGPIGNGLGVIDGAPNLCNAGDVKVLISELRKFKQPLDFIVIDTLASVTPGANENSGEEMGKMLAHCKAIQRATGAMVLLIHHSGKDSSKGARGWSGIRGALDVEIEVERLDDPDGTRCARITKMKDGEDIAEGMYFKLERLTFPNYQSEVDGETIIPSSCVVIPAEKPVKLGHLSHIDMKETVSGTLAAMIGEASTDYDPSHEELIQSVCSKLPEGGSKKDKKLVNKVIEELIEEGRIVEDAGRYRLPAPEEQKQLAQEKHMEQLSKLTDDDLAEEIT